MARLSSQLTEWWIDMSDSNSKRESNRELLIEKRRQEDLMWAWNDNPSLAFIYESFGDFVAARQQEERN